MIHAIILAAIPLLGGFANRIRGGLWGPQIDANIAEIDGGKKPGTQLARIFFAVVMAAFCAAAFDNWWLLLTVFTWELGEFLPNGDFLGLVNFKQFLEADGVGVGNVLLTCVAIFFLNNHAVPLPLVAAGLLKGCVYYVANRGFNWMPSLGIGFNPGAEMAEFIFGIVLGAGISLSAMMAADMTLKAFLA